MRCLDPAPFLGSRIRGFHAALLMSATLAPLEFFASALGVDDPATLRLELPSPFPRENRRILVVPSVDTRYRRRSAEAERIAGLLARCTALRPGNYLAFFSSFAYRDEVVAKLPRGELRVLLQTPAMPTEPFLRALRQNRAHTQLLCAVQGGVFAEGVDYPGEMALGVFVVGPGIPPPSVERELLRAHHDANRRDGFEHAYVHPGMARVAQAGGRALRSPSDRAFIVLLDRRFAEKRYREQLPAWWQEELLIAADPEPALRAFWATAS